MAVAFEVIYTAIDDDGDRGTTTVKVPTGFSLSDYGEFGAAMATLIDAMMAGKVESADLCFTADVTGLLANTADNDSDVEEIGAFQFDTFENRLVSINVPGLDELKVTAGTDDIDTSDPDVAALLTAVEVGINTAGGTISPCDIGEDDIVSLRTARERFRSSGARS